MRRAGCAVGLVFLVLGMAGAASVWLVASAFGIVGSGLFARAISVAALILGAIAVLGVFALARRLTAPANRLVDAAARIEAGDFGARVPVRGPAELRSVARAFNAMSDRLEASAARRRSAIADLAHELRTPLSIIRGQAEAITDGVYTARPERMAPILDATRTIEALIDDLGTLALAEEGGLLLAREPVDVAALVDETVAAFHVQAELAGVTLSEAVSTGTPAVDADPGRIRRVLGNLVSNALRHAAKDGSVVIAAEPDDRQVVISVSDNGEGIPPDLLPHIFDRFVRGPASNGSGLGLAIVRDIVEAHGGSVEARSRPGVGTTLSVRLPQAQA